MKRMEMERIVRARLEDAQVLYEASRFDGSVYLCGYAIEIGLKMRVCHVLKWDAYPKYQTFKTHDLDVLLNLTALEEIIKLKHTAAWSIVALWNPEARYKPIGSVQAIDAQDMLEATKEILEQLI